MKISVAMAVYNGEKYIKDQINSILPQLSFQDEIIISYDPSSDSTLSIIKCFAEFDSRIKVVYNHNPGVVKNFENALMNCIGEIIFYSDQDDVWLPSKIDKIKKEFLNQKISVVVHDTFLTDSKLNVIEKSSFAIRGGASSSLIMNLIRLRYIGCAMAFRSSLLCVILPFPVKKRSHDWWTGTICSMYGKMTIINEQLIYHRIHENNVTPKKRPGLYYQFSVRLKIITVSIYRKLRHLSL